LLLLAEDLLGFWDGVRAPARFREVDAGFRWSPSRGPTDYDRACDVDDYLGLIEVGPGTGLVLGDAPLPTAWVVDQSDSVGYLARWIQADPDLDVRQVIRSNAANLEWNPSVSFALDASPLVLFDAAQPGDAVGRQQLRIQFVPGQYDVATAEYCGDKDERLLLHRFLKRG
jgi:hypothetical protein